MLREATWTGWRLEKFDAVTWKRLASVDIPLNQGNAFEADVGPVISYVNGMLDVVGLYTEKDQGMQSTGTHHHFFTTDLEPKGKLILNPPEVPTHAPEGSEIQEPNGDILMFMNSEKGVLMLRFDKGWKFLSEKILIEKAFFATGLLQMDGLTYLAYIDLSLVDPQSKQYPVFNVHLAVFDANWNLVQDEAATTLTNPDHKRSESAWLMQHGNYLYLGYMVCSFDPDSDKDLLSGQAYVNVYELTSAP